MIPKEYWPTQEWKQSIPEELGMNSATLVRMFEYVDQNKINFQSLLIMHNGYLATEAFWHPYGPNDKHSAESITKQSLGH